MNFNYNLGTICTCSPECIGFQVAPNPAGPGSFAWPTANRAFFFPFSLARPMLCAQLFNYNGGTASGNLDIGIYAEDGTRLHSTGSTAQSGTNALQVINPTDKIIPAGQLFLALAMDGTTGTVAGTNPSLHTLRQAGALIMDTAFPLPAVATFAAWANAIFPIFGFTSKTVI